MAFPRGFILITVLLAVSFAFNGHEAHAEIDSTLLDNKGHPGEDKYVDVSNSVTRQASTEKKTDSGLDDPNLGSKFICEIFGGC
ncbi:hypothetical protein CASFOL_006444 [Castilleja foliolosa]|uniref:Uncharacterized protein n=1 Tax=Castilleja foliolosa TaxID=1961234 RepID=A0ABD3E7F1_9LAMI